MDLPSGLDRADGQSGRLGTATPANAVQIDSPGSIDSGTLSIEEKPDSPIIERAEQATITKVFTMDWTEALTRILTLGRGTIEVDGAGNVTRVLSATIKHEKGEVAELTKVSEGLSFDSPPDKFRITAVKLDVNIMKHPRYFYALQGSDSDEAGRNQAIIRVLQNYFDNTTAAFRDWTTYQLYYSLGKPGTLTGGIAVPDASYTPTGQTVPLSPLPGTDLAKRAALEIVQKYWIGIETPYIVGLQISWTSYYFRPPYLNLGGYVENPMTEASPQLPDYFYSVAYPPDPSATIFDALTLINPQCYSSTGLRGGTLNISWLREADDIDYQRTWFEVTRTWIGSPVGFWDPQIYTTDERPQVAGDYFNITPAKITAKIKPKSEA